MALTFKITPSTVDQRAIDLCAKALTSSTPPLNEDSEIKIARIREVRLESIEGADKYEATKIFDALNQLPPLEGSRIKNLLVLLTETDFTPESLTNCLNKLSTTDNETSKQDGVSEWGFLTSTASIAGKDQTVDITLDAKKSWREGLKVLVNLYAHLSAITNPELRTLLVEDCSHIIDLRLSFDLS